MHERDQRTRYYACYQNTLTEFAIVLVIKTSGNVSLKVFRKKRITVRNTFAAIIILCEKSKHIVKRTYIGEYQFLIYLFIDPFV